MDGIGQRMLRKIIQDMTSIDGIVLKRTSNVLVCPMKIHIFALDKHRTKTRNRKHRRAAAKPAACAQNP